MHILRENGLFGREIYPRCHMNYPIRDTFGNEGHKKAFTTKENLTKAFDHISWLYIKLILVQIGFLRKMIQWMETFFHSVVYVVLINGSASNFIHPSMGL
jgi:hypothetical protein